MPTADTNEAAEIIGDAQQAAESATSNCQFVTTEKRKPNEQYWLERIAAEGTLLFDPVEDNFFSFFDGLWTRRTRPETREIVNRFIRANSEGEDGLKLDRLLSMRNLDAIVSRLCGHPDVVQRGAFAQPPHGVVLVENGCLRFSRDSSKFEFCAGDRGRPEDRQQTRLAIKYDGSKRATKTLAWLRRIFSNREADVQAVAKMMAAALYGSNRWKKLVAIWGKANLGKSQIAIMVERLVGRNRVTEFETKRLGEKFEMRRFVGKVVLRAEDVEADFMTRGYSDALKQLSGFSPMRVEPKGSHEEFIMVGDKVIVVTSNFRLRVKSDVDRSAWEERLVYLEADGEPYGREEQDSYFLDNLFEDADEASGILNLAVEALVGLLPNGWERSEEQMLRIKKILDNSEAFAWWAKQRLTTGDNPDRPGLTVNEAWKDYHDWAKREGLEPWPDNPGRNMLIEAVATVHGNKDHNHVDRPGGLQRGWSKLQFRNR